MLLFTFDYLMNGRLKYMIHISQTIVGIYGNLYVFIYKL